MPVPRQTTSSFPSLRWPVIFASLSVIVFLVGASTVRETYHGWKVDKEIEGLRVQVGQLEAQKHTMSTLLEKMNTDSYVEQEARLRFNLKKPGERMVMFQDSGTTAKLSWSDREEATPTPAPEVPNSIPHRWFQYFFPPVTLHTS